MGVENADFSGYATKANLKCSDGRTITPDAFKEQDSQRVPLVWQHAHNEPTNILGYAMLEHREDGTYAYGYFNDTPQGVGAKKLVEHGDITALSIYANRLVEKSKTVMHGVIREVSLVLAGANPGARIDQVNIQHADGELTELDDEAIISMDLPLSLKHSDTDNEKEKETEMPIAHADKTVQDVFDTLSDDQKEGVYFLVGLAADGGDVSTEDKATSAALLKSLDAEQTTVVNYMVGEALKHDDFENADDLAEPTVQDVFDTLDAEQKNVVYYMLGQALQGDSADPVTHSEREVISATFDSFDEDQENVVHYMIGEALQHAESSSASADDDFADDQFVAHSDDQEGSTMKHNVFETGTSADQGPTLSHEDMSSIMESAKRPGETFKSALDDYALAHGIQDISILFPDAKAITSTPEFLARRTEWVAGVMTETRHTPFSRIKTLSANLTLEAARAKGYIKGNFKKEEFFRVSKRVTTPQTIYKKQKLDRDDILDITDFDVVAWLKGEMRLMLEEEIARAVLLGDGRSVEDEDKINEEHIRPIATDSDFYVTYINLNLNDANSSAEEIVDALVMQRRNYRGSGNPTLYTSETVLSRLLLVKDTLGRRIYPTVNDVASAIRVAKIVTVELMDEPTNDVIGIIVNLQDYTIGADRGGDVAMFDDFDIDYNQQKYLIETRISGALTKPKSALVVKSVAGTAVLVTPAVPTYSSTNHSVTVPTTAGVTYKNKATGATLVTGTPVVLAPDTELVVQATANSGYYTAGTAQDEFLFTYADGYSATY